MENNDKNNLLLYVAIVLNPKKKKKKSCISVLKIFFWLEIAKSMGSVVEQCLRHIFHEYSIPRSGSSNSSTNTPIVLVEDVISNDCNPTKKVGENFNYDTMIGDFECDETTTFDKESEIDVYLLKSDVKNEHDFDILQWWKNNNHQSEEE